jgi:hypothetical protein
VVQITAVPDSGWEFDTWSGEVVEPGSSVTTVIMDSDKAVTANWKRLKYHLTLNVMPPGITAISGDGWYEQGTTVLTGEAQDTIYATEGTRYVFSNWTVDNVEITDNPLSLTMDSPHQVTANYKKQYYLRIYPEYGSIVGTGWYDAGSKAEFSVSPSAGLIIRHIFAEWGGDFKGTTPIGSVLMDQPKTVVIKWRTDYLRLYILAGVLFLVIVAIGVLLIRKKAQPL